MAEEIGSINFDGVEATQDKNYTRPGVRDVFKITKVELGRSKTKKTLGMTLTFENSDSQFNHTFYLEGSTPDKQKTVLGRVQALHGYIYGEGSKLQGTITPQALDLKFKNKELALKVIGEVSTNGKGFATLGFSGFGKPKNELEFLRFTAEEEKAIAAALEAIEQSRSNRSDSESSGGAPSGGSEDFSIAGDSPVQTENF